MQKINSLFFFSLFFLSLTITAQVRKYSNEFLNIGAGAKALGMGKAQVAVVNDVSSGFWNPAGLNRVSNDLQFTLSHAEHFAGISKFDYGAAVIPIQEKTKKIGFSLIRFGVDEIPNTLFLVEPDGSFNYDNITSFSVADYAGFISYAQKITIKGKPIDVGANVKIIHRRAGKFAKSWGFGLDVGAQYQHKNWQFGILGKDLTSTFNAWSFSFTEEEKAILTSTDNVIPENSLEITVPTLILGTAYYKNLGQFGVLGSIDLDLTNDGKRNTLIKTNLTSIDPKIGVEGNYKDIVFIRAGVSTFQRQLKDFEDKTITTPQPSLGVGLKIKNFSIDYALNRLSTALSLYSHFLSLSVNIDKTDTD